MLARLGADKPKMSTIYDVAELAGVSAKTVSRVLNEDRAVKEKTRARVLEAMMTLEYRPSKLARQLRLGQKNSIGFLLEDATSGYQSRFNYAFLTACMEAGKFLAVELYENGADWQAQLDRFISDTQTSNMILLPTLCDFGPLKAFLKSRKIRCALISPSTPDPHFSSVAMDDRLAAREVTDYLMSLGHQRIAHISGHPDHAASILRRNGYYEAFDAAGLPRPPANHVVPGEFTFKTGLEAAERLLSLKDRPTAIFASNDEMAAGASSAAHKMGLHIPKDLSIVGFDDAPVSSAIWPALTTVRQPYLEMARRCMQIFNGAETNMPGTRISHIVPHELVIRETTGPVG